MGKGKALVLHLFAIAAGWGIVAALRPVVGSWQGGGEAAAEISAPSKTGRIRSPAEVAAGEKLLQRLTDTRLKYPPPSPPGPELSFEQLIDESRRLAGFDPAAPAASWEDEGKSEEDTPTAWEYQRLLRDMLESHLNGEHGPDLAHAFRRGRLDAVALYDSLAVHLPGAAINDTLRIALYQHLAPLDPERAAALLQLMKRDAAIAVKYETFEASSYAFTPDTTFALLSAIPPPSDDHGIFHRQVAWMNSTDDFLDTYGSDYLLWVESLPVGVDRDCAAVAIIAQLQESDIPRYRRMRALVSDPDLLEAFPPR